RLAAQHGILREAFAEIARLSPSRHSWCAIAHLGMRRKAQARNPFHRKTRGQMDSGLALRAPRNDERREIA
ncbi:hypothetical protein ABTO72_18955, partial [Acinetobacter baumannii]